ncbi:MAG: O-antigen ligase family protein [Acidimicrobiia bacterium]|nr:O-antigen ligase family protein [Acidimicrobiia bacterium]NNF09158.1 O-antigen ligase family protein [Acidimicrobiia bacterium]
MHSSETARQLFAKIPRVRWEDLKPATRTERFLYLTVLAFPVAWLAGFGEHVWLPLSLVAILHRWPSHRILAPRGFMLWIAFAVLSFAASFDLVIGGDVFGVHTHLLSTYLAGTILFLYVFNSEADELSDGRLIAAVGLLWVVIVGGGLLAVPLTGADYATPGTALMEGVSAEERVIGYTRVQFADLTNPGADTAQLTGSEKLRPKTFFSETNHWGSAFAILLPAAMMLAAMLVSGRARTLLLAAVALSAIPLVLSQNRWVWAVLLATLFYAGGRFWRPRVTHLGWLILGIAILTAVAWATPIGGIVGARITDSTVDYRQEIYELAIDRIGEAPMLGFGQAIATGDDGYDAQFLDSRPIGFDSQIINTMIFHGVPAGVLLVAWLLAITMVSRRLSTPIEAVTHFAALAALFHTGFYVIMPHRMVLLMILAAAMYRRRVLDGSYPLSKVTGIRLRRW